MGTENEVASESVDEKNTETKDTPTEVDHNVTKSLSFRAYSFSEELVEGKPYYLPSPEFVPNEISPLGFSRRQIFVIFLGLMLALFLAALDQNIVSTALPSIVTDFGRLDLYSWVVIAYLLTSTAIMPLTGKLSDIFGRKILFMGAVVVFLIGSILCGAATNMISLICFRALQGIGGGSLFSLTLVIIGDIVTVRERGRWMGMMGMTFAVSSVLGPVVGGLITDHITWRWIFYINVPIGIASLIVTWFTLKLPKTSDRNAVEILKSIDYAGIFTIVAGVIFVLLGASLGGSQYDWNSAPIILFFIIGGILLICFFIIETKVKEPIIQLRIFMIRNVALSNIVAFCIGFAMFGAISYLPIYFQVIHGDSPTISGLKLLPMMVGIIVFSIGSGGVITKTGRYFMFPIMGCGFVALGCGLIGGLLTVDLNIVLLSFFILLIGIGIGCIIQTVTAICQAFVAKKDMATATATNSFLRTMGGVIGVTVFGSILNNQLANNLSPQLLGAAHQGYHAIQMLPTQDLINEVLMKYTQAISIIFYTAVPVAGVAMILSFLITNKKLQHTGPVVAEA